MNKESERVEYLVDYVSKLQLARDYEKLEQELEKRTKQYENVLKRYQELETKNAQTEYNNKKAIEYIENVQTPTYMILEDICDVLDILKGVDKE